MGFGHFIKSIGKNVAKGVHKATHRIEHGLRKADGWYHKHRNTFDKIRHGVGHVIDKGTNIADDIAEINPAAAGRAKKFLDDVRRGADTINKKIDQHEATADEHEKHFKEHAKKLKDITQKVTGNDQAASEGPHPLGLSHTKKALHPPNSARTKKPSETVPGSQARPSVKVRRKRSKPIGSDPKTWAPNAKQPKIDGGASTPTGLAPKGGNTEKVGGPGTLPPQYKQEN